jgi:hypothetical protein
VYYSRIEKAFRSNLGRGIGYHDQNVRYFPQLLYEYAEYDLDWTMTASLQIPFNSSYISPPTIRRYIV